MAGRPTGGSSTCPTAGSRRRGGVVAGPKDSRKPRVLIHADPHIHSRRRQKLGRSRENSLKGPIAERRGQSVDRVGSEVRRRVEGVDQQKRDAGDERRGAGEHGPEARGEGAADGEALGGFLDDGSNCIDHISSVPRTGTRQEADGLVITGR